MIISAFISANSLIYALGWTLVHSLWQIALIALILRIVTIFMKNRSASSRYNMSVAALTLVLILSVATFSNEYSNASAEPVSLENSIFTGDETAVNKAAESITGPIFFSVFKEKLKSFIDKNLNVIVIIWNICVLALLIKLLGGLIYSQRMKYSRTSFLPDNVHEKLKSLTNRIKIKKTVKILESAIVKVPVVIGYFKPVILLPAGIMTGLTNDQIEAIIAHELAHIKRNDYLINIFQSIIEILFFYHPATWYISNTIRNERESACDDMALAGTANRMSLAKALTNIEIINHKKFELTMAFTRNKNSLLNRLKRIVYPEKRGFTFREGLITILIIAAGLTIMSFSAKLILNSSETQDVRKNKNESVTVKEKQIVETKEILNLNKSAILNNTAKFEKINEPVLNELTITDDTIVKKVTESSIEYSVNSKFYILEFDKNKNPTAFSVDNKTIPKKDWKKYDKEIKLGFYLKEQFDKHMAEFEKQTEIHEQELKKHEEHMAQYEKQMQKKELEMQKYMQLREKEIAEYEIQMQKHESEMKDKEKAMKEYQIQMEMQEGKMKDRDKVMKEYQILMQERETEMHKQMKLHEEKMKHLEPVMIEKEKAMKEYQMQMQKHATEMKKQEKVMKEYEILMQEREIKMQKQMKMHEEKMKMHEKKFEIIEEIIEEMKKDKLIDKDATSFKIKLTDSELIVNDKKQSKKVFEKYKSLINSKSKGDFELDGEFSFEKNEKEE